MAVVSDIISANNENQYSGTATPDSTVALADGTGLSQLIIKVRNTDWEGTLKAQVSMTGDDWEDVQCYMKTGGLGNILNFSIEGGNAGIWYAYTGGCPYVRVTSYADGQDGNCAVDILGTTANSLYQIPNIGIFNNNSTDIASSALSAAPSFYRSAAQESYAVATESPGNLWCVQGFSNRNSPQFILILDASGVITSPASLGSELIAAIPVAANSPFYWVPGQQGKPTRCDSGILVMNSVDHDSLDSGDEDCRFSIDFA